MVADSPVTVSWIVPFVSSNSVFNKFAYLSILCLQKRGRKWRKDVLWRLHFLLWFHWDCRPFKVMHVTWPFSPVHNDSRPKIILFVILLWRHQAEIVWARFCAWRCMKSGDGIVYLHRGCLQERFSTSNRAVNELV